jgi:4-nitrophenyl phosphatase
MLSNITSLILDMDGVLWRDDAPIGDLPKIFARIRARGLKFVFATNNGTKTPEQYMDKLSELGVTVEPWQVITSALGVAEMLKGKIPAGAPVFVIGGDGVKVALREQGFEVVPVETAETAQAVVMGVDRDINFAKMCEATLRDPRRGRVDLGHRHRHGCATNLRGQALPVSDGNGA